jgi:hypothetical protein
LSRAPEMYNTVAEVGTEGEKSRNRFLITVHRGVFNHRPSRRVNVTACVVFILAE